MNIKCFVIAVLLLFYYTAHAQIELSHIKGCQTVGIRGGLGTKNKFDVGLTYSYCFNKNTSLVFEFDHEEAVFGHSDFTNSILISPGIEYNVWNPTRWLYFSLGGGAAVGYDVWDCDLIDERAEGIVYGIQVGTAFEFFPWPFLSAIIKAQQYLLFGNDDQYLKPNFSLGIRYNFHF